MKIFHFGYLVAWVALCLAATRVVSQSPSAFSFTRAEYRRFLFVPWKLVTVAFATLGITLIAPYTGDPTWDYIDAMFMSVLTFLTAPWAVGTVYLALRGQASIPHLFVAICLWMFSASWSYDLYLLIRDGRYPDTWLPNMVASSVLYIAAGLLWNLDWRAVRGVTFSFLEDGWFAVPPSGSFSKVFWYALPFMLIASAAILYFVVPDFHR